MNKLPVIVISGFLGSGKTTLLLSLLSDCGARGLRPGVLMNELGGTDVDGHILQEYAGLSPVKLLDGCVCCSRREDLADCLQLLLSRKPDVIFMELTGVADPGEIAGILGEQPWNARLSLHKSITLADAEHVLEYNSLLASDRQLVRTVRRQLQHADLVIVNKCDLAEQETLWKIEAGIRKQNARADIVFTHYARIQTAPLLGNVTPREHAPAAQRAPQTFRSGSVERTVKPADARVLPPAPPSYSETTAALTLAVQPDRPLPKKAVENFLKEWGDSLLRAKGYIPAEKGGTVMLVQYAGGRAEWEQSRYPGRPYLVLIGTGLDAALLRERWAALYA